MRHPLGTACLALVLLLAAPAAAVAGTFYLGTAGCSDSGSGTSQQPWCTFAAAMPKLRPGDTLLLNSGTYNEQLVINVSGTAGNPITIAAAKGAKPVLDGAGLKFSEQGLIQATKQRHLTIRGLTLKSSPFYCLLMSGCHNVTLEQLKLDGCYHGGVVFDEGSSDVVVRRCDISKTDSCGAGCGIHEAITLSNTTRFEVAYNHVHDTIKEGIDAKDGSSHGSIHHNVLTRVGQVALYLNHAFAVKLYRNVITDGGSSGIQLSVGDFATGLPETTNNAVFLNVVNNCKWNGVEIWSTRPGQSGDNLIFNNVFYGNGSYGVLFNNAGLNTVVNNILMLNVKGGISGNTAEDSDLSNNLFFKTGKVVGTDNVTRDPKFVNAAKGDFRLRKGSPAIDKGLAMGLPALGQELDIGAHEYPKTGHPDVEDEVRLKGCQVTAGRSELLPLLALLMLCLVRRRTP